MIAAENAALPYGKVGGVGDVLRDVPNALAEQQQQVDVIVPGYGLYQSKECHAEFITDFEVKFAHGFETVSLFKYASDTELVTQWILEHELFAVGGIGNVYCADPNQEVFAQDATKFALFCAAVASALVQKVIPMPNVVHLHDWHTGFFSLLQKFDHDFLALKDLHTVFTVHNLAIQGQRPFENNASSLSAWFPSLRYSSQEICDPVYQDCLNPLRSAIHLADKVHIVSPSYAQEILSPSDHIAGFYGGEGLEQTIVAAKAKGKLHGILNGCQYLETLSNASRVTKTEFIACAQQALLLWAAKHRELQSSHFVAMHKLQAWQQNNIDPDVIVTSVGRLTRQKVALLVEPFKDTHAIDAVLEALGDQGMFLMTGSGDPALETMMTQAMAKHNNFIFLNGYDDALGQLMYRMGDLFLMPSSFEPCGISQMLAMQHGQPCLVNDIGGLKDTVNNDETGFVFSGDNTQQQVVNMLSRFNEALSCKKHDIKTWDNIVSNASQARFSWQGTINNYLEKLYQ